MAQMIYGIADEVCFANCTKDTGNKYNCSFGDGLKPANCINCMKLWLESEVDTE